MTGIAIGSQRIGGALGRTAAAVLLVLAGVAAGIGIANMAGLGGSVTQPASLSAGQLASDEAWQAYRAGERQPSLGHSGDSWYQEFRAGERQP